MNVKKALPTSGRRCQLQNAAEVRCGLIAFEMAVLSRDEQWSKNYPFVKKIDLPSGKKNAILLHRGRRGTARARITQ